MTLFKTYLSDEIYCSIVPRSLILYFSSEQGYSYLCCTIVKKKMRYTIGHFLFLHHYRLCACVNVLVLILLKSIAPGALSVQEDPPSQSISRSFDPFFSNFVCSARFLAWHEKINLCKWTWESLGPTYFILRVQFFFFTSAECLESSLACVTIDLLSTIWQWHDHGR